jgi:hypothetical protein
MIEMMMKVVMLIECSAVAPARVILILGC